MTLPADDVAVGVLDDQLGVKLMSQVARALHRCGSQIVQGLRRLVAVHLDGPVTGSGFD